MAGPDSTVKCRQVGETAYTTHSWDINFRPMIGADGNYVRNEFGDARWAPDEPQIGPHSLDQSESFNGILPAFNIAFHISNYKHNEEAIRNEYIRCLEDGYNEVSGQPNSVQQGNIERECRPVFPEVYQIRLDREICLPGLFSKDCRKSGEVQHVVLATMEISCDNVYEKTEVNLDEIPLQEVNTYMLSAREFHEVGMFVQELARLDGHPGSVSRDDVDIYGVTPQHRVWREGDYTYSDGSPNYRIRIKMLVDRAVRYTMGLDETSDRTLISLLVNAPGKRTFSEYVLFENLNVFLRAYEEYADAIRPDSEDLVYFDSIESTHVWTESVDGLIDGVRVQKAIPPVADTERGIKSYFSRFFSN